MDRTMMDGTDEELRAEAEKLEGQAAELRGLVASRAAARERANVVVMIGPTTDPHIPFRVIDRDFEFERVPCPGEIVNLGNDEDGCSADYKVKLVHHLPVNTNGIRAELYLERVELSDELTSVKPGPAPARASWKPGSQPSIPPTN